LVEFSKLHGIDPATPETFFDKGRCCGGDENEHHQNHD